VETKEAELRSGLTDFSLKVCYVMSDIVEWKSAGGEAQLPSDIKKDGSR